MSKQRIRSPSVEIVSYRPSALSTQPANAPTTSASAQAHTNSKKRKSTDGDVSKAKRAKTIKATEEPKDPAERWKWINLCKPEVKFKGTKVEVFNCGGTFFKTTAKTLEMRLDKLQVYYDECQGDETCHPHYGYPELCKPSVKARKGDAGADRWSWINKCRPDMLLKGTSIEAYNCGGRYFRATGKTIEDRFDKIEKFLNECEGDETCHPTYGTL